MPAVVGLTSVKARHFLPFSFPIVILKETRDGKEKNMENKSCVCVGGRKPRQKTAVFPSAPIGDLKGDDASTCYLRSH